MDLRIKPPIWASRRAIPLGKSICARIAFRKLSQEAYGGGWTSSRSETKRTYRFQNAANSYLRREVSVSIYNDSVAALFNFLV